MLDGDFGDIDDELPDQSTTTDQNWELITAAISQRESREDAAMFDCNRERNAVAHLHFANGAEDALGTKILRGDNLAGIKRATRAKKGEFEMLTVVDADVTSPDRREISARVHLGRHLFDASNIDKNIVPNNG